MLGVTDGHDGVVACGNLDAELFFENWLDLEGDRLGCFVYTTISTDRTEPDAIIAK